MTKSFAQIQFLPWQYFHTGSKPLVTAIGDLNNDGLNDVAITTGFYFDAPNDYKLFVFYQDTFGLLSTLIKYAVNNHEAHSIAIADMNNDGLNDVVVSYNYTDSLGIFYQNTAGFLDPVTSFYCGHFVDAVNTGDLNNDGLTDIAASLNGDSLIKIFYQDTLGGLTLNSYPSLMTTRSEINIADVNDDGLNDVVYMPGSSNQYYKGVRIFLQDTTGLLDSMLTYSNTSPTIPTCLEGIAVGDINNDDRNDVLGSESFNSPNAYVSIWQQDSATHLLQNPVFLSAYDEPEAIEIADLNNDSKNEIVALHGGWYAVTIYEQDATGNYGSYTSLTIPYATSYKPQGLSIGDFNNDEKKDIAIADYNNGLIVLYNSSIVLSNKVYLKNSNISVFPNPFIDKIDINIFTVNNSNSFHIRICDMQGKECLSNNIAGSNSLDLTSLKKGIYSLIMENNSAVYVKKIVKI